MSSTGKFLFHVPIGGEWVEVWEDDLSRDQLHGYYDGLESKIVVHSGQTPHQRRNVLLHEYIHATAATFQIRLSEKDTRILEQALMQLLNSDPWRSLGPT